jgi:hypothetical protein
MGLLKTHKIAALGIAIYYLWWCLFFYVMNIPGCNLGIPLVMAFSLLIAATYLITIVIKLFLSKGQTRDDYFVFLWLAALPVFLVLLYFLAFI